MRTIRTKIYKFEELGKEAQENALNNVRQTQNFDWLVSEAVESLRRFCDVFNIRYSQFDFCQMNYSRWEHRIDDVILNLSGQRLATWIWNNKRGDIYEGKYYGRLSKTDKHGNPIQVSKEHPTGQRHVKRYSKCQLSTDCVLTGVCYDMDLLEPIYKFLDTPDDRDLRLLLDDCLRDLAHSVRKEIEYRESDEAVKEEIASNDLEFYQNGKIYG